MHIVEFQETIWNYYAKHGRDLPWRMPEADGSYDPYKIMVSELMLQQTQVSRVIPKYHAFLVQFPTVQALANAPQSEVITAWSGLGYNRRARFLHQAAQQVCADFSGEVPRNTTQLVALPGIGKNTAAAIAAYAYNQPVFFVETNIRTVYIHHFFANQDAVNDQVILDLVERSVDHENPREWYWALMDYGVHIKSSVGNVARQSAHYVKQSAFVGSKRQIRGELLRILANGPASYDQIANTITDQRLAQVVEDLIAEKLVEKQGNQLSL